MKHVDLNVDLAEGCSNDQRLLQLVTSANVACGLHAGDFNEMRKAIRLPFYSVGTDKPFVSLMVHL